MWRFIATGLVSAAGSIGAVVVGSGAARDVFVAVAALSALLLAYWGARHEQRLVQAERRLQEAHQRTIELSEQLATTATSSDAAWRALHPILEKYGGPIRPVYPGD